MTVKSTSSGGSASGVPCASEECVVAWSAVAVAAPRGWQPNPVISREAAAMCETDYKSFPHWPPQVRGSSIDWYRVHFPTEWERSRPG